MSILLFAITANAAPTLSTSTRATWSDGPAGGLEVRLDHHRAFARIRGSVFRGSSRSLHEAVAFLTETNPTLVERRNWMGQAVQIEVAATPSRYVRLGAHGFSNRVINRKGRDYLESLAIEPTTTGHTTIGPQLGWVLPMKRVTLASVTSISMPIYADSGRSRPVGADGDRYPARAFHGTKYATSLESRVSLSRHWKLDVDVGVSTHTRGRAYRSLPPATLQWTPTASVGLGWSGALTSKP